MNRVGAGREQGDHGRGGGIRGGGGTGPDGPSDGVLVLCAIIAVQFCGSRISSFRPIRAGFPFFAHSVALHRRRAPSRGVFCAEFRFFFLPRLPNSTGQ